MAGYGDSLSTSSRDALSATVLSRDLSTRTSLSLQHEPYSAIFISVPKGRR